MNSRAVVIFGFCLVFGLQAGPANAHDKAMCGGIAGKKCSSAEYCDFGGGKCRMPDASGTCKTKPEICTKEFAPVCGCNGTTYSNSCESAMAGVSVDHTGECKPQSK